MTMKAVIDTSVYVSMLLSGRGTGAWLMALWKERRFELVISPVILEELVEVLARPQINARLDPGRSLALLRRLRDDATWVEGRTEVAGLSAAEDDFLLAEALESEAEVIVSWDQRLLDQGIRQGVHIINPEQFTSLIVRTS
jgi:putative PIN family toxin of toxin-antitoxin system